MKIENICAQMRRNYLAEQREKTAQAKAIADQRALAELIAEMRRVDDETRRRMKPIHAAELAKKEEQRKAKYELHQAREARRQKK